MKRGFPAKSPAKKLAEGDRSHTGKAKLAKAVTEEPKPPTGLPSKPPSGLSGRAKRTWITWVACLETMKLDKMPDAQLLEGACIAYDRAVQAELLITRQGMIQYVDGVPRRHPAIDVSLRYWDVVRRFCIEFGFTPAARVRLTTLGGANAPPAAENGDDLMERLGAGRTPRGEPKPTTDGEGSSGSSERVH